MPAKASRLALGYCTRAGGVSPPVTFCHFAVLLLPFENLFENTRGS